MGLSPIDIATIVNALQESDWDEAVVVVGDARIAVARNGARIGTVDAAPAAPATTAAATDVAAAAALPPAATASPAATGSAAAPVAVLPAVPAAPPAPATGTHVPSPSVGVFWSSPEPGAPPFVSVGDRVSAGDVLCIVEIMKLMTNVHAKAAGVVEAVLVSNGDNVEFGTPLFLVRED